jgi:hypothetical protein
MTLWAEALRHEQTQLCVHNSKTVSDSNKRSQDFKIRCVNSDNLTRNAAQKCSLEAVYWQFGTTPSSGAAAHISPSWHSTPLLALLQGKLPHTTAYGDCKLQTPTTCCEVLKQKTTQAQH